MNDKEYQEWLSQNSHEIVTELSKCDSFEEVMNLMSLKRSEFKKLKQINDNENT